jgi:hypothetical protein
MRRTNKSLNNKSKKRTNIERKKRMLKWQKSQPQTMNWRWEIRKNFLNHEKIFYKKVYTIILFILSVNDFIIIFVHNKRKKDKKMKEKVVSSSPIVDFYYLFFIEKIRFSFFANLCSFTGWNFQIFHKHWTSFELLSSLVINFTLIEILKAKSKIRKPGLVYNQAWKSSWVDWL